MGLGRGLAMGTFGSARAKTDPPPPAPGATIPEAILACFARAILRALRYIHSNHRVHRDLKPANILLGLDGTVKVCGRFGVGVQWLFEGPITGQTAYFRYNPI